MFTSFQLPTISIYRYVTFEELLLSIFFIGVLSAGCFSCIILICLYRWGRFSDNPWYCRRQNLLRRYQAVATSEDHMIPRPTYVILGEGQHHLSPPLLCKNNNCNNNQTTLHVVTPVAKLATLADEEASRRSSNESQYLTAAAITPDDPDRAKSQKMSYADYFLGFYDAIHESFSSRVLQSRPAVVPATVAVAPIEEEHPPTAPLLPKTMVTTPSLPATETPPPPPSSTKGKQRAVKKPDEARSEKDKEKLKEKKKKEAAASTGSKPKPAPAAADQKAKTAKKSTAADNSANNNEKEAPGTPAKQKAKTPTRRKTKKEFSRSQEVGIPPPPPAAVIPKWFHCQFASRFYLVYNLWWSHNQ